VGWEKRNMGWMFKGTDISAMVSAIQVVFKQQLFEHNPLYDLIQEIDTATKTGSDSSVQNQTRQGIHQQHKGKIT
jgi:hypothetical protein